MYDTRKRNGSVVESEAGPSAPCRGERRLELTVSLKIGRHWLLQPHLKVAQRSPDSGRHQQGWGIYGLSPLLQTPRVWDAEAAPCDVALLGTGPFIFLKLLLLPTGNTSLADGWVLSPLLTGLASGEDTVIKTIRNLLMKLPSPAGKHFPITWTIFAILDFSIALLKAQADAAGVALPLLVGTVASRPLKELMGQVLP